MAASKCRWHRTWTEGIDMPIYDYKCREHGVFNELATLDEFEKPAPCPACGTPSPRVIVLAPRLLDMPEERRIAHSHNERARHEPIHSNPDQRAEHAERVAKGCACEHHRKPSSLFYTADGKKMFLGMRPWMISH